MLIFTKGEYRHAIYLETNSLSLHILRSVYENRGQRVDEIGLLTVFSKLYF